VKYVAMAIVRLYQVALSPLFPNSCKYHPSCSQYALEALRDYGLARGVVLAAWRLLRCNPWSRGGVDYARDQKLFPLLRHRATGAAGQPTAATLTPDREAG
jgi:putative membrane protein insertion efficiency factor